MKRQASAKRKKMTYKQILDLPVFISLDEARLIVGVSRSHLRDLAAAGEIPASQVGSSWRVRTYEFLEQYGLAPTLDELVRIEALRASGRKGEGPDHEAPLWAYLGRD